MIIRIGNCNRGGALPRHCIYNDECHKIGDNAGGVYLCDADVGDEGRREY
jgi:hypothetical protein